MTQAPDRPGSQEAENRAPEPRAAERKPLSTSDLAVAVNEPTARRAVNRNVASEIRADRPDSLTHQEQLAPLFVPEVANDFRTRWNAVQSSFVDDPGQAVRKGDELVAQVMKSLAESFAHERARIEGQMNANESLSTEALRLALQRYRSFFERLLAL
jgi:hypothetical protein